MLDVLIIGGGPIGMAAGIEAKKAHLNYTIIEKGCLVNSLYNYPVNMTFFSTSEKLEIGDVPFVSHNSRPTRAEALEYYRRVQGKWELDMKLFEQVQEVNPLQEDAYEVITSKGTYQTKSIIIATGFFDEANMMQVPGEDLPKVKHYYDDPHYYALSKVAVIGASNSAIDAALQTYRKGAEVSLIIREPEISHRVKYWVKPDIENRIKEGSIKAYFNAQVKAFTPHEVIFTDENGEEVQISNDFVLAMTGYKPNFSFLEKIGIEIAHDEHKTPVHHQDTHETNMKNIFLAGVVCGGLKTNTWFIENSRVHAEVIINELKHRLSQ